jgi:sugar phosphate permease
VLLSGYLSDKVFHGRRFPVGTLFLAGLAVACLVFPALSQFSRAGNWLGIALLGILTFGPDTLMGGAATQDAAEPDTAATAAGFVNGVGSVGQLLSPLVVSVVVKAAGWDNLFFLFVACAAAGSGVLATRWASRPMWQVATQEA